MTQENIINPVRLKELFRRMVDIYSPSGKEQELTEFLADYLRDSGIAVSLREVSEGRENIEVVFSEETPVEVAFIGHIDTVAAYDIEDYGFFEKDDTISGLGTADMKSGCAAMIEAFIASVENGLPPEKAALFLVVGEEESGDGTAELMKSRMFPWAIVGEPTNLAACLSHYGYVEISVRAFGTRRHASKACRRYNAIFGMLDTLLEVGKVFEETYPNSVLNIRDIQSSEAGFAVPGSCQAWIDLHLPPNSDLQKICAHLKSVVEDTMEASTATACEVEFPTIARGYNIQQEDKLALKIQEAFKELKLSLNTTPFESHSDANILWQAGCKPIILGPGTLAKAHTSDESVQFSQIVTAAEIYRKLLNKIG